MQSLKTGAKIISFSTVPWLTNITLRRDFGFKEFELFLSFRYENDFTLLPFDLLQVGPGSEVSSLHCLCNHLTSFGGGVLVMPNKLDFDVVFYELTRLHETGNVAVLVTIIAVLLLYFLVVVFARKYDRQDKAKVCKRQNLHFLWNRDRIKKNEI